MARSNLPARHRTKEDAPVRPHKALEGHGATPEWYNLCLRFCLFCLYVQAAQSGQGASNVWVSADIV